MGEWSHSYTLSYSSTLDGSKGENSLPSAYLYQGKIIHNHWMLKKTLIRRQTADMLQWYVDMLFMFVLTRNSFPLINIAYLSSPHYTGVNRFGMDFGMKQLHPVDWGYQAGNVSLCEVIPDIVPIPLKFHALIVNDRQQSSLCNVMMLLMRTADLHLQIEISLTWIIK